MRLRNVLAATAASALLIGAVGTPAHSLTPSSPANAGSVVAWGDDRDPTSATAASVPSDVTGLVASVSASTRATAVVVDGALRVWGASEAPQVSDAPSGVTDATAVVLGLNNGAAIHADGHVTTWGGSEAFNNVPSDLRAKAISVQYDTGFAVRPDGTLTTWGDAPMYDVPTTGLANLVDISTSPTHTLALHADGTVTTWGVPSDELLAIPDFGGKKVTRISTGYVRSGVVLEDGTMSNWGDDILTPTDKPYFDGQTPAGKVVSLSLSPIADDFGAAVTADGEVHAWGRNSHSINVPASLTGQPVSAVAVGGGHVAVIVTTFRDLTKPTIAGTPAFGQTLTATPATFSLTPDAPPTGQWYADNDPIAGKSATTLTVGESMAGKSISYRSTATRGQNTITSASPRIGPVPTPPPVTPPPAASTIALSVSSSFAVIGRTRSVSATVISTSGTPTGSVTFSVGTKTAVVALSGGKATWTLPALAVGTYSATAAYSGDSTTAASAATPATITVTKAPSKVTGKPKATGKSKKATKKVTITLIVSSAKGVSLTGKVSVTVKGVTKRPLTVKVNSAGRAVVRLKNVKHGKRTAKFTYAGNRSVSSSTGSVKFTS